MIVINIANDYTKTPGGRYKNEGEYSGEDFRVNFLYPAYQRAKTEGVKIEINLDGGYGYPTSFLEEAFGGLARQTNDNNLLNMLVFISEEEPALISKINAYIREALK